MNKTYLDTLLATGSPRAAITAASEPCIEFRSDTDKYDYNIVETLLFAGNYQLENGGKVTFYRDGRVDGLDSDIYKSPKYAFKFKNDTLFLYKLNCLEGYDSTDNSCSVVDFGQLKWKLIRKNVAGKMSNPGHNNEMT